MTHVSETWKTFDILLEDRQTKRKYRLYCSLKVQLLKDNCDVKIE